MRMAESVVTVSLVTSLLVYWLRLSVSKGQIYKILCFLERRFSDECVLMVQLIQITRLHPSQILSYAYYC